MAEVEASVEEQIEKLSPKEAERAALESFFDEYDTDSNSSDPIDLEEDDSGEEDALDVTQEDEDRINELISISGTKGLTEEEVEWLQSKGIEVDDQSEGDEILDKDKSEEEPKDEPVEQPYAFDDILKEVYDTEFETPEEKNIALREYLENQKETSTKLYNVLSSSPELQSIITEMIKDKADFRVALAKNLDLEAVIPKPGDDGYKEWVAEEIKREAKLKEQAKKQEEFVKNQQRSVIETKNFLSRNELDDNKARNFLEYVDTLAVDFANGRMTDKVLKQLYKGWSHDETIEKVKTEGEQKAKIAETRGANRKIVAITRKKSGDGVKTLPAGGAGKTRAKSDSIISGDVISRANMSFMDMAKQAGAVK